MTAPWKPDPVTALVDSATHESRVRGRVEARERRQRATELATWIGTLRDLAEAATPVIIGCAGDRAHRGALRGVGRDHLVLASGRGWTVVRLDVVRSVRPTPQARPPAMGDRGPVQGQTLAEVLERLVERRAELTFWLDGVPDPLRGVPVGLGEDVLTIAVPHAGGLATYVPVSAVAGISV